MRARPVLLLALSVSAGCAVFEASTTGPVGTWKGEAKGSFMDASGNMVEQTYLVKFDYREDGNVTVSFPGPGAGWVNEDRTVWVTVNAPGGRLCTFTGSGVQDDYATGPLRCEPLPDERSPLQGEWWAEWEGPSE